MPSSVISAFHYDADTNTLKIIFVTGKIYKYKKVPLEIYDAMKESFSKGIYFNNHIKDKYEFDKVK